MRSEWKGLAGYAAGAALTAWISMSTPNPVPFVILGYLIAVFGVAIIDRLALIPAKKGLQPAWSEDFIALQVDHIQEK